MIYRYCGASGVQLPVLSLGLWHNFGSVDDFSVAEAMLLKAFDSGICHFDLANNYGPVPGSAEENFGRILKRHLSAHRDEMLISSKAGHDMWPGVYGTGSSRKNIIASCDQSLRRMGLDYVDVFYSHRYDGVTPVEETMQALVDLVRSGKALYVGISKYPLELQQRCYDYLREHDTPCLVSQYRASMFNTLARPNLDLAAREGSGFFTAALSRYRSGSPTKLVTLSPRGEVLGEIEAPEGLESISAHGKQVLALCGKRLIQYNQQLEEMLTADLEQTSVRQALLLESGRCVLVFDYSAEAFTY